MRRAETPLGAVSGLIGFLPRRISRDKSWREVRLLFGIWVVSAIRKVLTCMPI